MAIARVDQSAYNDWGEEAILSEEFLVKDHKTWETGKVSINHENNNDLLENAKIIDIEYEQETQLVWATFPDLPQRAKDLINSDFYEGLSQECIPLEWDGNRVIKGYGVGVTIVTYPYKPAATPDQGVGVRPTSSMALAATLASKYPEFFPKQKSTEEPEGGDITPSDKEELETKIKELTSSIEDLKSQNEKLKQDLVAKDKTIEIIVKDAVESAVSSALVSRDNAQKVANEREDAIKELESYMTPTALENFLKNNPSTEVIKATSSAMAATLSEIKANASKRIGAGGGGGGGGKGGSGGRAQSIYTEGKSIYEKAGLTEEDLKLYGDVE